ncbi:hypothetical protein [Amycolatopsis sp. WGS_07]|uniref:hypothetical protein n=1 Tax=Amycolatopsis sp. WGS_07 TaxID=3076764 RepID=UPI003872BB01
MPQHDRVEAAEPLVRVGEEPLRREPVVLERIQQLVPQPDLRDGVASGGPLGFRPVVGAAVVTVPLVGVGAPVRQPRAPFRAVGGVGRADENLGLVQRDELLGESGAPSGTSVGWSIGRGTSGSNT